MITWNVGAADLSLFFATIGGNLMLARALSVPSSLPASLTALAAVPSSPHLTASFPARLLVARGRPRSLSLSFACFRSPGSRFQRDRAKYLSSGVWRPLVVLSRSSHAHPNFRPLRHSLFSPSSRYEHMQIRWHTQLNSSLIARYWKNNSTSNSTRTITSARHQPDYTCNLWKMS